MRVYIYIYIYIYINCTVNMGLTVSEKSVFSTSFGRGRFQGNLFIIYIYKSTNKCHSQTTPSSERR